MASLPWMKFFPSDWLTDTKLSLCKPSTRGIWMDLICRMHDADTGTISGSWERIASLLRCTVEELRNAADDLYRCDVGDVVIGDEVSLTSRRITRDINKRKACSEAGKRGGGNPALRTYKGRDKGRDKGGAKGPSDIWNLTSDSVPESSEGGSWETKPPEVEWDDLPVGLQSPEFRKAWEDWKADRKARKKPMTERAKVMQLRKLAEMGVSDAIRAIEHSLASGYTGIFPAPESRNGSHRPHPSASRIDIAAARRAAESAREFAEPDLALPIRGGSSKSTT